MRGTLAIFHGSARSKGVKRLRSDTVRRTGEENSTHRPALSLLRPCGTLGAISEALPVWLGLRQARTQRVCIPRDRGNNVLDNAGQAVVSSHPELNTPLVGLVTVSDCDQGRWCKSIAAPQL